VDPDTPEYLALKAVIFSDYRLTITGLVEQERRYTLAELRNMPSSDADHPARLCGGLELQRDL